MTPGGISGVPTAPRRMASSSRQLVEDGVGQDLAGAQVPRSTQVVVDGVEVDAGRPHRLEGLGDDVGTDPVPTDDTDLV